MSGPDPVLGEIADALKGRLYGKFRGIVSDVDAATMMVRARVPDVSAADLNWAMACVPYAGPQVGFMMLPEIDSGVWIEFEQGDPSRPIWVGCYWLKDQVPSSADAKVKAVVSAAGTLALDDDAKSLSFEDTNGNKLIVDGSGVLAQGSAGKVAVGSTVSINDGALEVS